MTSPAYSVFVGDGGSNTPKRPTALVDLGGLSFQDSIKYPPKDRERLSATDFMQTTMSVEAIARMIPTMRADVLLGGGPPTVLTVTSVNSALTTSNVISSQTGTGTYTLSWPTAMLPPGNSSPTAIISYAGSVLVPYITVLSTVSVGIAIFDATGAASNTQCYVSVSIY